MPRNRLAAPRALDDLLLYRINRLLGVGGSAVIRLCEGRYGITRREWRVLGLLAGGQAMQSSQLAERAQLDRARTSRAVTSLVAKKLVRRHTPAGDRRAVLLELTAQGQRLYDELFPLVVRINQDLLDALTPAAVARLDAVLDALQRRADETVDQALASLPKADRRRGGRAPRGV